MTVLATAALLVGCGTVRGGSRGPGRADGGPRPAPAGWRGDPHRQVALRDAAAVFAAFRPPPGAHRSATLPAGAPKDLAGPPERPAAAYTLVDDGGWWVAPGKPQAVLGWIARHRPAGFSGSGSGSAGQAAKPATPGRAFAPGGTTPAFVASRWWRVFAKPASPGVLDIRWLAVQVSAAAGGQTAIRADALVTWLPTKQPTARVPAGARVLTVTVRRFGHSMVPVTVTGPAVSRIAALVDRLPVMPPGPAGCPADFGVTVTLTFRAARGGPVLAQAVADPAGCGNVILTVRGQRQQPLAGGPGLVRRSGPILGSRWPLRGGAPAGAVSTPGR